MKSGYLRQPRRDEVRMASRFFLPTKERRPLVVSFSVDAAMDEQANENDMVARSRVRHLP